MTISIIIHVITEVLTTGVVVLLGNKYSTISVIDPVVAYTLIIDTRIEILYLHKTCVSSTKDSSMTLISKNVKGQIKYYKKI